MDYGNDLHQLILDFFVTAETTPVFLVGSNYRSIFYTISDITRKLFWIISKFTGCKLWTCGDLAHGDMGVPGPYKFLLLGNVRRIHRWPVNSSCKRLVTRKMVPFDDVIMGHNHFQMSSRTWWLHTDSTLVHQTYGIIVPWHTFGWFCLWTELTILFMLVKGVISSKWARWQSRDWVLIPQLCRIAGTWHSCVWYCLWARMTFIFVLIKTMISGRWVHKHQNSIALKELIQLCRIDETRAYLKIVLHMGETDHHFQA